MTNMWDVLGRICDRFPKNKKVRGETVARAEGRYEAFRSVTKSAANDGLPPGASIAFGLQAADIGNAEAVMERMDTDDQDRFVNPVRPDERTAPRECVADTQLARDVRNCVQSYLEALKANHAAIDKLLDALPSSFSDRMAIAHTSQFMRQFIEHGDEQLAGYSDEIILGEPFLNRMDEVIGEINIGLEHMGPTFDHIHTRFGTSEMRRLVGEATSTSAALTQSGVDWQFQRAKVATP